MRQAIQLFHVRDNQLADAETFYERMGMMDCGEDPNMDDLTYFEWYRRRERSEDGL